MKGTLVKNKLTGAKGMVINCNHGPKKNKLQIYYLAEEVPLCNLIGRQIFSYAGNIVFCEYCFEEEIETINV